MKLVVFILNREELLEQVLEAFVESGVPGATVLESAGMGRMLTSEVPLFADLQDSMKGIKPANRVIFSLVSGEGPVRRLEKLLGKACGDLSVPGNGLLFTVPVDYARGLRPEEVEA
ncbi:MAG: hypothetical protein A2V99_10345 [Spirochaetes bacterium RBG_16_67_19]|nr:MAG: hypothetical protein A2V99_10345 [Spirochaetes bacterium RBG_16_67_19]